MLDHIAVAAETLEQGVEYVEKALGVPMAAGGQHELFGTHNKLLRLGDVYLEVITVDPRAGKVPHPRWFDLDRFKGIPRVSNWICKTQSAGAVLGRALDGTGPMVEVHRGDLRWHITVPQNGCLPLDGCAPAIIDWGGLPSPALGLPDLGCRLHRLKITHPKYALLKQFLNATLDDPRVELNYSARPSFEVEIDTPRGKKWLR